MLSFIGLIFIGVVCRPHFVIPSQSLPTSSTSDSLKLPSSLKKSFSEPIPAVGTSSQRKAALGNLFLSSCPGKKVRLSGPVNGRGGVCRDLKQDLQRMKDLGGVGVR